MPPPSQMNSRHVNLQILLDNGSQSVVPRPVAAASPGTLLEMHILRPTPTQTAETQQTVF